jgi:transposase InsO family protein
MAHIRGAPRRPQTQGKIERRHQTLKNWILLEHYYPPSGLEEQLGAVIEPCNNARVHESLSNLTPADVCFGRREVILAERDRIKRQILARRRLHHHAQAA